MRRFEKLVICSALGVWGVACDCSSEDQKKSAARSQASASPSATADAARQHLASGFIVAAGVDTVVTHCTSCHSAKLITQNRLTKEGWNGLIGWMQKHHNLGAIPEKTRKQIVSYLAENYGPEDDAATYRRPPLPEDSLPPTAAELAQEEGRQSSSKKEEAP